MLAISAGTSAQDVAVNYQAFLCQNLSESARVYIKERDGDGTAASAANGWAILPGATLDVPLTARTLSVVADGAADLRLLILED